MTHLKIFIFLALLCVFGDAQFFEVPANFDIGRIVYVPWYSVGWFNNIQDTTPTGCLSYQFTRYLDSPEISYEYTYNYPDVEGPVNFGIFTLAPTDESLVFDVINNAIPRKFNILAYDEDYNWLVIGDTAEKGDPWVDIIVRDVEADNSDGVAKAEEEADKYGLRFKHDVNQNDDCQYGANRDQLSAKKEEQEQHAFFFDLPKEKILGGPWYSVVWFDTVESEPYGCSSYQFVRSSDSDEISYDYSYNYPDIDGEQTNGDYTLAPTDDINVFDVTDDWFSRQFTILAHDEDYNWVVFEDSGSSFFNRPWVDLIVRDLNADNSAGVARAEEEAAKYGFGARHDIKHSDACQYQSGSS